MTTIQHNLFTVDCNAVSVGHTALSARGRRPSEKQAKILEALRSSETISLADAVRLVGANLYCNAEKHVGVTLSNMVKRGMIERVKPGVFRLPNDQGEGQP